MIAADFIEALDRIDKDGNITIPKREIFALAKEFKSMPTSEVVLLLRNDNDDYRLGAVSILDFKARDKKTSEEERQIIYKAYINNHEWIDNWGLVDRSAPYVVGGYLYNKSRKPLYDLARSDNPMERRTAIVSTYYFIRKGEIEDTFSIAEILVQDEDTYVQKAVGSWIREAGKKDEERLLAFLDKYATQMSRVTLRYAIEKCDNATREHYLNLK